MKGKKFAVFDIDGTIFRSSLLIELVDELISQGIISRSTRNIYISKRKKWKERRGSYEDYINSVVLAFKNNIRGVREKDFINVVKTVIRKNKYKNYIYTTELIKQLKRKGYFLIAISHSPKYIVEDFCKKLGFDEVYGCLLEIDENGKFTGKNIIDDKELVLRQVIEKYGLDLRYSIGVGDTESDLSFLKMVKTPICFNPNKKLFLEAKKRGWKIVVERKDVIYNIQ